MITQQTIGLVRTAGNPLIAPCDVKPTYPDWEVLGVFNAGVTTWREETVLLLRVAERPRQTDPRQVLVPVLNLDREEAGSRAPAMKTIALDKSDANLDFSDPRVVRDRDGKTLYLTSISHLRVARSQDGLQFEIDDRPSVLPEGAMEVWGIEDPRITRLGELYYITYSAISDRGVAVGLLTTEDFISFQREGLMLAPTNKDVAIFPEPIGGRYFMLHRPVPDGIGHPEMWVAESPDLQHWGNHRFLMGLRADSWENARIGAGCVPIKTSEGWLILYHGANRDNRYCMGAALLDLEDPSRVIARLDEPFMVPEAEYETSGFFHNVIFACGAVVEEDRVVMYYGASDDTIASATFSLSELLNTLQQNVERG